MEWSTFLGIIQQWARSIRVKAESLAVLLHYSWPHKGTMLLTKALVALRGIDRTRIASVRNQVSTEYPERRHEIHIS